MGGQAGTRPPRPPAHAAALVRLAPAAVLRRSARRAGAARPREHRQHADLHAPRLPVPGQDLRSGASKGEEAARAALTQKNGALSAPRMTTEEKPRPKRYRPTPRARRED